MHFQFLPASMALSPLVVGFYHFQTDREDIRGVERAGVGHIRFVFKGIGETRFSNGREYASRRIMINGPGTGAINYRVRGPFRSFGVSMRPIGWFSLIGVPANEWADSVRDGHAHFGDSVQHLYEALHVMDDPVGMVAAAEAFLLERARPVPDEHASVCETVGAWLADPDAPNVDALFAKIDLSSRQVVRLVNQYYGAPPKVLERKIRALKAALALANGTPPRTVAEAFYDQSHMNREIRHFTGYTPGAFAEMTDSILAESLNLSRIGELRPPKGA